MEPGARQRRSAACQREQIRSLARDWGTTTPAAIRLNYGMQRVRGGGNAVRAIACLPALTGAWRHRAGGMLLSSSGVFPVDKAALQRPDLLAGRTPRTINMVHHRRRPAARSVARIRPKDRGLMVYNSNPVAVAPESSKVVAGFAREDLFTVVLEHFQTDTADYADYILPATTQLEHWDVHLSYGHTDVLLNRPAIAPVGEARPNTQIFRELAQRMGYERAMLRGETMRACAALPTATGSISIELMERGYAHACKLPDAPFAQRRFSDAFGQMRVLQRAAGAPGIDGLPDHVPNYEAAGHLGALSAGDDFAAGTQLPQFELSSTFAACATSKASRCWKSTTDDAAARGIADGRVVRVFNDRGEYRCKARVSQRARGRRRQWPGRLVAQARAGGHQRQPAHQPEAHRHGPRPGVLRLPGRSRSGVRKAD